MAAHGNSVVRVSTATVGYPYAYGVSVRGRLSAWGLRLPVRLPVSVLDPLFGSGLHSASGFDGGLWRPVAMGRGFGGRGGGLAAMAASAVAGRRRSGWRHGGGRRRRRRPWRRWWRPAVRRRRAAASGSRCAGLGSPWMNSIRPTLIDPVERDRHAAEQVAPASVPRATRRAARPPPWPRSRPSASSVTKHMW